MRHQLDGHLLNFIILFQKKAEFILADAFYQYTLSRRVGHSTFPFPDRETLLRIWFNELPQDELDLLGVKKNRETFWNLYNLCVLNTIPAAWLETPPNLLNKFTVDL